MQRNFPNFLDAYLQYSSGHESTARVRKWSCISILAAALERKVYLPRGYYTLFPNLYTFIIGKSGLIKKTTSTGIAVNLLREVEGVRVMSERLTAGSIVEQLLLAGKKYQDGPLIKNQSALFAYASELSVFLEEVFGNITTLLTTFYDCVPHDSLKPWVYNTIGRGERKIYGPCLNILGASTKSWLKKCIPRSEMEGGFTSRIIFVVENNLPETLVPWPEIANDHDDIRGKLVQDLKSINHLIGAFTVTTEAKDAFSKWYKIHMRSKLPYSKDPRMVGYLSRKGDTVLKLAMVGSVSKSDTLIITLEDLIWANEEIDALEEDWLMAFDSLGVKKSLRYEISRYVKEKHLVKKDDLFKYFGQFHVQADVVRALEELKTDDEIESALFKMDDKPTECYCIKGYGEVSPSSDPSQAPPQ